MQGAWSHACVHIMVESPLFTAVVLCFLVRLLDFCAVALSTLLSEIRNKLFKHRRHLPLECSLAVRLIIIVSLAYTLQPLF